jgi:hypothetical protein
MRKNTNIIRMKRRNADAASGIVTVTVEKGDENSALGNALTAVT